MEDLAMVTWDDRRDEEARRAAARGERNAMREVLSAREVRARAVDISLGHGWVARVRQECRGRSPWPSLADPRLAARARPAILAV